MIVIKSLLVVVNLSILMLGSNAHANTDTLVEAYKEVLEQTHGIPVPMRPSQEVCFSDAEIQKNISDEIYTTKGDCWVTYHPKITGFYSPAVRGSVEHIFSSKASYSAYLAALSALKNEVENRNNIPIMWKLDMQLAIWEILVGLDWRSSLKLDWSKEIDGEQVRMLIDKLSNILDRLLFTSDEIKNLPSNLDELIFASSSSADFLSAVHKGDKTIYEDIYTTSAHSDASLGRLSNRVFFRSSSEDGANKLRHMLISRSKDKSYDNGVELVGYAANDLLPSSKHEFLSPLGIGAEFTFMHRWIPDVDALLVTYFNVLDENYRIRETKVVQSVKRLWFDGIVDWSQGYDVVNKQTSIDVLEYTRVFDYSEEGKGYAYESVNENKLTRVGLVDVSPVKKLDAMLGTTLKSNCLQCHGRAIGSFNLRRSERWPKKLGFSPPFHVESIQSEAYKRTKLYYEKVLKSFQTR